MNTQHIISIVCIIFLVCLLIKLYDSWYVTKPTERFEPNDTPTPTPSDTPTPTSTGTPTPTPTSTGTPTPTPTSTGTPTPTPTSTGTPTPTPTSTGTTTAPPSAKIPVPSNADIISYMQQFDPAMSDIATQSKLFQYNVGTPNILDVNQQHFQGVGNIYLPYMYVN